MPGLMDEIRADQRPQTRCKWCTWVAGRDELEQTEWVEACADRSFSNTSIHRAAVRRGFVGSYQAIERHRKGHA